MEAPKRVTRRKRYNKEKKRRARKSVEQRLRCQHAVVRDELNEALAEKDALLRTAVTKLERQVLLYMLGGYYNAISVDDRGTLCNV